MVTGEIEALLCVAEYEPDWRVVPPYPGLPDATIVAGDLHHIGVGGVRCCRFDAPGGKPESDTRRVDR